MTFLTLGLARLLLFLPPVAPFVLAYMGYGIMRENPEWFTHPLKFNKKALGFLPGVVIFLTIWAWIAGSYVDLGNPLAVSIKVTLMLWVASLVFLSMLAFVTAGELNVIRIVFRTARYIISGTTPKNFENTE